MKTVYAILCVILLFVFFRYTIWNKDPNVIPVEVAIRDTSIDVKENADNESGILSAQDDTFGFIPDSSVLLTNKSLLTNGLISGSSTEEVVALGNQIIKEVFATTESERRKSNFAKNFTVKQMWLIPIYDVDPQYRGRRGLLGAQLRVQYAVTIDELMTNTNAFTLTFSFLDYRNGHFIRQSEIAPKEEKTYQAMQKGIGKLISVQYATELMRSKSITGGKGMSIYTSVGIKDDRVVVNLMGSDFNNKCNENGSRTSTSSHSRYQFDRKEDIESCTVNMLTSEASCKVTNRQCQMMIID